MILTFLAGFIVLAAAVALVRLGFLIFFAVVFIALAFVLAAAFALTTWATGRRVP